MMSLVDYCMSHHASISRFICPEVDTDGTKLIRARCLWSSSENLSFPSDFKICETSSNDRRLQLCFQQSTRNSAGPKVDLSFCPLRNFSTYHDVCDLQPSAGS